MTRRGLVLGGGGVLGAAWMVGALTALEEFDQLDARDFDLIVGTSAGSVIGSLIAAGVSVDDLRTHQLRGQVESGPLVGFHWDYEQATGGDRPTRPRAGFGSVEMLRRNMRQLHLLPPLAVLSAILPEGSGRLDNVGAMVRHVVPSGWVSHHGLVVTALDYDAGRRVAFGTPGAPEADLADAVMASCAIPAWYQPVRIGESRYVDGGAWSSTNVDLVLDHGLDEIVVIAPQISFDPDVPEQLVTRLERQWRARITARVLREVQRAHAEGIEVTLLGPGREDLEAFGPNMMDVERRPRVIETSLRTSKAAFRDPGELPTIAAAEAAEAEALAAHTQDQAEEQPRADGPEGGDGRA